MTRNPLTHAQRQAAFWRAAYLLTVPPMFLALCITTHYAHERQAETRRDVVIEIK